MVPPDTVTLISSEVPEPPVIVVSLPDLFKFVSSPATIIVPAEPDAVIVLVPAFISSLSTLTVNVPV